MKISTTTIAALLSIAGTTCGVNAEAMAALTNNASRVQAQERRRHLEDKCEEEFNALDTCFEADAVNCGGGVGDEGVRKLFGERRSEFSRSLSHGRHLDENTCDGYQLDACAAAGSYPDCACADEYLLAITCEANIEKELMCNLTYEVCDQVPCVEETISVFQCFEDNAELCEDFTIEDGVERRRHLEDSDGDFTCDDFEFSICLFSSNSCPCVEEVTAASVCQAELNDLECTVPTQETCDELIPTPACIDESIALSQCVEDNAELCEQDERRRHLEDSDGLNCDSFEFNICFFSSGSCPCVEEVTAASVCQAELNDLECTVPTQETCDELIPCIQKTILMSQCYEDNAELCEDDTTEDGVERRRHLEDSDGDFTCDFLEVFVCLVSLDSCPCVEEVTAVMLCQAELNGLDCAVPTQETCDSFACAACGDAAICFSGEGYCSYDQESKLWSGFYELCNGDENGSAADCAQCFPDAECSDICTACNAASPCFDNTGYCFYDEESQLWSGVFEDCNQGAASCAECYPDAECDGQPTAVAAPSYSPSAAPSYSPSAAPSSSPSADETPAPSAGVTCFKSLGNFVIVTVVSSCVLFM